jgi:hypothetical protein
MRAVPILRPVPALCSNTHLLCHCIHSKLSLALSSVSSEGLLHELSNTDCGSSKLLTESTGAAVQSCLFRWENSTHKPSQFYDGLLVSNLIQGVELDIQLVSWETPASRLWR